jgi:hypothetical protein
MLEKYRATIHGNTIEWDGEAPKNLSDDSSIKVDVTIVSTPKPKRPNGRKMAAISQRMADRGGVTSIENAVEWQREIRKDRKLPGR